MLRELNSAGPMARQAALAVGDDDAVDRGADAVVRGAPIRRLVLHNVNRMAERAGRDVLVATG